MSKVFMSWYPLLGDGCSSAKQVERNIVYQNCEVVQEYLDFQKEEIFRIKLENHLRKSWITLLTLNT